jgi:acetate kinase
MNADRESSLLLAVNGGSSSLRFALYANSAALQLVLRGKLDRIGHSNSALVVTDALGQQAAPQSIDAPDHHSAIKLLLDWLDRHHYLQSITAAGHRLVHGMTRSAPQLITPVLLDELHRIMPFDPEHLPFELELITTLQQRCPALPQVACFDTAFHRSMPMVARQLPIPRRYQAQGVERYGFHGLSYAYLCEQLQRLGESAATHGKLILAHLGNGASMAAIRDGKCIDTSMGFTPASGLMMSTRSGDLDPSLSYYLAQTEGMTTMQFQQMVNHESGLLGVSASSADVRDLLSAEATDSRAAEAIALFCYQAKKCLGSFAAALGGVDALVFAGGIGEHAPVIRERICAELGFLGIHLDATRNAQNALLISTDDTRVRVRVIATDEELMIARLTSRVIDSAC